jgi:aminopeptidase N
MALTQARAEQRASVIRTNSVSYNFHISLQKGDSYSGYAELTFELDHLPAELVVDFKGKQVTRLLLNGEVVEPKIIDGFIFLDLAKLKVGNNLVAVHYANRYDNDGTGCYSFIDVDTRQYIYTELEPYAANKVFPCFDQPDLKAKMKLSVICPSDWKKVLSNEYPTVEKDLCL